MHIFFSGIGGTGIGPLALIAKQAGYEVSGSDKQESQYIDYLRHHGINDIHIGQTEAAISSLHQARPIDWYVFSSALPKENPDHPELRFIESQGIKHSKRDEFLNRILEEKDLKLIAIAGTHGKTTTTAMVIWLFKELGLPISYSVGAKTAFADMGEYDPASTYFVYECDEFDRNFLAFKPFLSLIVGIAWDHHEVFPTQDDYLNAFREFISQSHQSLLWQHEVSAASIKSRDNDVILSFEETEIGQIRLEGLYNRRNAYQAIRAVHELTKESLNKLVEIINEFPGVSRRMEEITPNLYTDYAHTPEKVVAAMNRALEMAETKGQKVIAIYEPLTNRRMHYTKDKHADVFNGADKIYWVPSYLAREDPNMPVLTPSELIKFLSPESQKIAKPMELDPQLKAVIQSHIDAGDLVIAMSGGGGHSLDEWLRKEFK